MHFRDSSDNFFVAIAVAAGCSCGGVSGSVSGLRLSYVCFGGAILTTCPGGGGWWWWWQRRRPLVFREEKIICKIILTSENDI